MFYSFELHVGIMEVFDNLSEVAKAVTPSKGVITIKKH